MWDRWLQEYNANNSEKVDEIETKLKDAETKLEKAKKELKEAEQEYKDAKASVPAGRGQAGASACAVVAVDFGLHAFSCGPPLLLFGVMLSSQQGSARR